MPGTGWRLDDLWLAGEYCLDGDGFLIDRLEFGAFGGRFLVTGKLGGLTEEAVEPVVNLEITGKGIDLAAIPLGNSSPEAGGRKDRPLPGGEISNYSLWAFIPLAEQRPAGGNRRYDRGMGIRCPDRGILLERYPAHRRVDPGGKHRRPRRFDRLVGTGERLLLWGGDLPQPGAPPGVAGPGSSPVPRWSLGRLSGTWRMEKKAAGPAGAGWLELHDLCHEGSSHPGRLLIRAEMEGGRLRIADSYFLTGSGRLALTGEVTWEDGPDYEIRAEGADLCCNDLVSLLALTGRPVQEYPALEGMVDLVIMARGGSQAVVTGYLAAEDLLFGVSRSTAGRSVFPGRTGRFTLTIPGCGRVKRN